MSSASTLLRYPGGKSRARKIILPMIPDDIESVCAPFFGGGSVEISLANKDVDVYGYDLFEPVANFWEYVLKEPHELADSIEGYLGEVDRDTFYSLQESLRDNFSGSLHDAAIFFVINRCSFSGATLSGGYSLQAATKRFTESSVNRVRAFSQPHLHVSHGDAFDVIPDTEADFLFLDPPYLLENSTLYGDSGSHHLDFDHKNLREVLDEYSGKILLTYNNHPDIHTLYDGFNIYPASWKYGMNSTKDSSEIIITNYDAT